MHECVGVCMLVCEYSVRRLCVCVPICEHACVLHVNVLDVCACVRVLLLTVLGFA